MKDSRLPKTGADDFIAAGLGEELPRQPRAPLGRVQPVELTALLARTYPETAAIIGAGVVPRQGLAIVGGPPKKGKSLLTTQLVLCRSLGWPWLGFSTAPGVTLALNAEVPEPELQARLRLQVAALATPIPAGVVHVVTHRGLRLDRPDGLRLCRTLVESYTPDLLLVDPLARFMTGDENSTREMGRLIAALDELIQSYALAIVVVHHTSKPSSEEARDGGLRLRGSSALFAAADSVLILDRAGDGIFRLSFELRHGREPEPMLLRRTEALWLEPSGPPDELVQVAAIVERLPLRYRQLLDAVQADLSVKERTAQALVARAKKAGLIAVEGGLYRPTLSRNGALAEHGTATDRNAALAVVGSAHE